MNRQSVLFVATGSPGNIRVYIAAARACVAAGVPVVCCTNRLWERWVRSHGVPWRELPAEVETYICADVSYPDIPESSIEIPYHARILRQLRNGSVRATAEPQLIAVLRDAALIVCSSSFARVAKQADTLGIQSIGVTRFGAPLTHEDGRQRPVLFASSSVLAEPAMVQSALQRITGEWLLPESEVLPGPLERFMRVNTPYIIITHGAFLGAPAQTVVQHAVSCAQDLGMRSLVLLPSDDTTIRSDAQTFAWHGPLSHQQVIAGAACVVHSGGAGTTHRVLRAGVPGLAIPLKQSDEYWAHRALQVQLTVSVMKPNELTKSLLSDALAHMLTNVSYRYRSRALATQMSGERGVEQMLSVIQPYLGVP